MVNPYDIIMMPWITEKAMEARTSGNRLEFIVRRSATKAEIASAVETVSYTHLTLPTMIRV